MGAQVPAVVIAHQKKAEGSEEEGPGSEGRRLALQKYPGPLKYPYLHAFLTTFGGMLGHVYPPPSPPPTPPSFKKMS